MDQLNRRFARIVAAVLALILVGGACSGDDDTPPDDLGLDDPVITDSGHESPSPETGGLEIDTPAGAYAVPLPSIGFGLALPDEWQATVLTDEALERVAEARLVAPFFLDAARVVAETGAVFYAAGIDADERVTDLKVSEIRDVDPSIGSIRTLADSVVAGGAVRDGVVTEEDGPSGPRVRLDFRLDQEDAETGDAIDSYVTQLFVPAGEVVWSLIITGEDRATHELVVQLVGDSFVLVDD